MTAQTSWENIYAKARTAPRGNQRNCWRRFQRPANRVTKPPLKTEELSELRAAVGASEGIRTLDVHLGKVMLYQTELRSRYQLTDWVRTLGE